VVEPVVVKEESKKAEPVVVKPEPTVVKEVPKVVAPVVVKPEAPKVVTPVVKEEPKVVEPVVAPMAVKEDFKWPEINVEGQRAIFIEPISFEKEAAERRKKAVDDLFDRLEF
jgi:hypothetical protein